MTSFPIKVSLASLLLAFAPLPIRAQELPGASVTIGLGAGLAPDYFGAGTTGIGPAGAFSVQGLVLPGGFGIGSESALPTDPGFGLRGAFRFVSSRKASDNGELRGLEDIDTAIELGLGLFQITERSRVYGEIRRGFGGHEGWVAEAGVDAILRPTDQLVLTGRAARALGGRRIRGHLLRRHPGRKRRTRGTRPSARTAGSCRSGSS
jgi:MipA family protein